MDPTLAQTSAIGADMSFGMLLFKTVLALVVILGLIVILFRYVVPRLQLGKPPQGGRIRILERVGLEPRKILYLVKIGKREILIGTSDHGVHPLSELPPEEGKENG